jgi:hypothetical protein
MAAQLVASRTVLSSTVSYSQNTDCVVMIVMLINVMYTAHVGLFFSMWAQSFPCRLTLDGNFLDVLFDTEN